MANPTVPHVGVSTVLKDLALGVRIPCLFILFAAGYNTKLYYEAGQAWQQNARFGTAKGKLLKLHRLKYSYVAVPRYSVEYEFEVDGVKYVSKRATTGSPYRDWMGDWYTDTITEAQYLQSIPLLRIGERCTVLYDRTNPGAHSAIAHDANSWEISLMLYAAVFPFLTANLWLMQWQTWRYGTKMVAKKIKMPAWSRPPNMPPPPSA